MYQGPYHEYMYRTGCVDIDEIPTDVLKQACVDANNLIIGEKVYGIKYVTMDDQDSWLTNTYTQRGTYTLIDSIYTESCFGQVLPHCSVGLQTAGLWSVSCRPENLSIPTYHRLCKPIIVSYDCRDVLVYDNQLKGRTMYVEQTEGVTIDTIHDLGQCRQSLYP